VGLIFINKDVTINYMKRNYISMPRAIKPAFPSCGPDHDYNYMIGPELKTKFAGLFQTSEVRCWIQLAKDRDQ
jgi:hypothetical protein